MLDQQKISGEDCIQHTYTRVSIALEYNLRAFASGILQGVCLSQAEGMNECGDAYGGEGRAQESDIRRREYAETKRNRRPGGREISK